MEGFTGEIRAFAGNFPPRGWHFCDGCLLSINDYPALYSLIGVTYGGNSVSFRLPDLRGRMPIGFGTGPQLTPQPLGAYGGAETVTLETGNLPSHNHRVMIDTTGTPVKAPSSSTYLGKMVSPEATIQGYLPGSVTKPKEIIMDQTTVLPTGGGGAHLNVMPTTAATYIICIDQNIYPEFND